mmetsp:Transcript_98411/g.169262  ORF Transcript_98411/g.169262 Transcript_98411/m.169262 type:complete len:676 (-) Transcript_98411:69-2096(-)
MGKRRPRILVWPIQCKHDVVQESYEELNWNKCKKRDARAGRWDVAWSDTPAALFREISTAAVQGHQRLNHFPLMQYLCRKDLLACNLRELRRALGSTASEADFKFMPETWIFPSEEQSFWHAVGHHFRTEENALSLQEKKARAKRLKRKAKRERKRQLKKNLQLQKPSRLSNASAAIVAEESSSSEEDELEAFTCIAKPQDGSQGKGIFLFQLHSDYKSMSADSDTRQTLDRLKRTRMVVQKFISKPLIVDDFKWDMRVYVLVTSLEPLTAYLYDDGLARFCTMEYEAPDEENLDEVEMHLTNFSINWESDAFIDTDSDSSGSKRSVDAVLGSASVGGDEAAAAIWEDIGRVTAQTLLAFAPKLRSAYQSHFGHLRQAPATRRSATLGSDSTSHAAAETKEGYSASLPRGIDSTSKQHTAEAAAPSVCFEILGFDFILDSDRRLYLLEVNSAPSLATETALDARVKAQVLQESFSLLGLNPASQDDCKRKSRQLLKARRLEHLRRRESLVQRKQETKAGIAFNSSLARDGKRMSADSQRLELEQTATLPASEVCAAGIPLNAVRACRQGRNSTDTRKATDTEKAVVLEEEALEEDDELGKREDEGDDQDVDEQESSDDGSEFETAHDFEFFGPDVSKTMEGVGPYVSRHFVQLLPNPAVPGHDAILAAAERLRDR